MLKDRILAGTIAGMIAAMVKNIPNIVLYKLGVVHVLYLYIASAALIRTQDINTSLGLILGVIVDIITGGTLGLLIIILFKITGRDYWWYKGLIVGNVIWLFGLGIAINFGASRIVPLDPMFRLTSLIEHQIFGLVGAYLIFRWYPEHSLETNKYKNGAINRLFPEPARKLGLKKKKNQ